MRHQLGGEKISVNHGRNYTVYEEEALLYRLHEELKGSSKDVVFVVGSPLTAPSSDHAGVTDVEGVVNLIRAKFAQKAAQLKKFDAAVLDAENSYQAAFDFLIGRGGQDAANKIIKQAVAGALTIGQQEGKSETIAGLDASQLQSFENDPNLWSINPGLEALAKLITKFPEHFGNALVTSNFDPLIEVAVHKVGGSAWRTSLSADGSIFDSKAKGCQVIHIHGFWHGSDTLHTPTQLLQDRPQLVNDFLRLIEDKIVVVVAYGGWEDIFTEALRLAVKNKNSFPEILWTFYSRPC